MLRFVKKPPKLFLLFILLVVLSFTGCESGLTDKDNPEAAIGDTIYNLTIEVQGEGTVEPAEGSHEYDDGATAIIEVMSNGGWFKEWSGNNGNEVEYDSENDVYKLFMDEDKIITAKFVSENEMVLVEAGTTSGSNGFITVANDFYMGQYHVTQGEFKAVMGFNPSAINDGDHPNLAGISDNRPVEKVTWYDAVKYANELSEIEGLDKYYNISNIKYEGDNIDSATVTENTGVSGFRLPTAVEHEYAARGGRDGHSTTFAGSNNLDEVGWYKDNSDVANSDRADNIGTMPVGEKEPNELGLYDMSGNVCDWTNTEATCDITGYDGHIMRGGTCYDMADSCLVDTTFAFVSSAAFHFTGFRLTRSP